MNAWRKILAAVGLGVPALAAAQGNDYAVADVYRGLRSRALAVDQATSGARDSTYGILMETGYPEAVVTLVAMADGTASLYFSNGGGIIGAGQHEKPNVAARTLVAVAAHNLSHMRHTAETPLPTSGRTRFYVMTKEGLFAAEASEEDLGDNRHVLSPLFYAAQELITEMRLAEESRK